MKVILSIFCLLVTISVEAQYSLTKLWESDTTLAVPESVLYHKGILYVSLVDGQALEVDSKGEIAKLYEKGEIINASWVHGLNAPKGMAIWKNKLYVTDINKIVIIDIPTGTITSAIPVKRAIGLNDITVDKKGTLYVSDSELGNVYCIIKDSAELYVRNLPGANGVKAIGNNLYLITSSDIMKIMPDRKTSSVSKMESGGDGIEPVGKEDFIVTRYMGVIYYLDNTGNKQTLLDTRAEKKGTADIGYNCKERIVYVPTLFKKSVVAYQLK